MLWDNQQKSPNFNGHGFLGLRNSKYCPEITHAQIRSTLNLTSLAKDFIAQDCDDISTSNSRAFIRTVNTTLKLVEDFHEEEMTDACLFQYPRSAIPEVEFLKTAQQASLSHKNSKFDKLNLSILTAAQFEDNFKNFTKKSISYHKDSDSYYEKYRDYRNEKVFHKYFVDFRLGIKPKKQPLKCGDNKKRKWFTKRSIAEMFLL